MNIDYEILFWVLVGVNLGSLWMIMRLSEKINDLSTELGVHSRAIRDTVEDYRKRTNLLIGDAIADIRDAHVELEGSLNLVHTYLEEVLEALDIDWENEDGDSGEDEETKTLAEVEQEIIVEIDEDPIHIITPNQFFFENNGHDRFKLMYDPVSDSVYYYYCDTTDEHIILGNVTECVGDALKYFGVNSKNDNIVYVRNNVFKADFMIERQDD